MKYNVTLELKNPYPSNGFKLLDKVTIHGLNYKSLIRELTTGSPFFKLNQKILDYIIHQIGLEFLQIMREPNSYYVMQQIFTDPETMEDYRLTYKEVN